MSSHGHESHVGGHPIHQYGPGRGNLIDSKMTVAPAGPEHTVHRQDDHIDIPPDGGYGWICVAAVFLINAHTWGVNSVGYYVEMAEQC